MTKNSNKPIGRIYTQNEGQLFGSREAAMRAAAKRGEESITFRLPGGEASPTPVGQQTYGSAAEAIRAAILQGEPSIKLKLRR